MRRVEVLVVRLEIVEVETPGATDQRRDGHVGKRLQVLVTCVPRCPCRRPPRATVGTAGHGLEIPV